jgi:hypothetical protein
MLQLADAQFYLCWRSMSVWCSCDTHSLVELFVQCAVTRLCSLRLIKFFITGFKKFLTQVSSMDSICKPEEHEFNVLKKHSSDYKS